LQDLGKTKIFIIEMVLHVMTGPDGWRNGRPQQDAAQRDAPRLTAFRQAIASFMFDRKKGLVFEKLKKVMVTCPWWVGQGMVDETENILGQTKLIGSGVRTRCRFYCFFAFGGKEEGIFGTRERSCDSIS
jgi:hypothetical protein